MEIGKVLAEYDAMFGTVGLDKIEEFLVMKLEEAEEEQDFVIRTLNVFRG